MYAQSSAAIKQMRALCLLCSGVLHDEKLLLDFVDNRESKGNARRHLR